MARVEKFERKSPAVETAEVALLVRGVDIYGIGTIAKLYANAWPEATFLCFGSGPLYDWLVERGSMVELIEDVATFKASGSLATLLKAPYALRQARRDALAAHRRIEGRGIRVLHTQWLPQQLVAGFMRPLGYSSVWQINNNMNPRRLLGLGRKLNHRLARWGADLLLPASDFIAANWKGCGVPIRTVRNAAEPLEMQASFGSAPPVKCLTAGRLEASKGHDVAVAAVLAARRAGCDITLDVFGGPLNDNPYADELSSAIAASNAEDFIKLRGFCEDLRHRHSQFHLGLQCRIDPEPCSLWVCETLVDGLPLIASATGGTPELVADGETGILVPPADAEALTEALVRICESPQRLTDLRDAARRRGASQFTAERLMGETLAAYSSLFT